MADNNLIRKTSVSKFYRAWVNMKSRCTNKKLSDYSRYGGRGIKVCKEWNTFDGFIKDMLPTYQDSLTLDRIDNSGNYCKENCRWATVKEQAQNTRNVSRANHVIFNGVSRTIRELAEQFGIKRTTLGMRLQKYICTLEKSLGIGGHVGRL